MLFQYIFHLNKDTLDKTNNENSLFPYTYKDNSLTVVANNFVVILPLSVHGSP